MMQTVIEAPDIQEWIPEGTRFALVPTKVIFSDISDKAFRLYSALASYADRSGQAFPFNSTLAEKLGWSLSTLHTYRRELVEAGLIVRLDRTRPKQGRTSSLTILLPVFADDTHVQPDNTTHVQPVCTRVMQPGCTHNKPPEQTTSTETPRDSVTGREEDPAMDLGQFEGEPSFDDIERVQHEQDQQKARDREDAKYRRTKQQRKNNIPPKDTADWCRRVFEIGALNAGHPEVSLGHLRMIIKDLRAGFELSYQEIEALFKFFFTKYDADVRRAKDPVAMFHGRQGMLMKEKGFSQTRKVVTSDISSRHAMKKWRKMGQNND